MDLIRRPNSMSKPETASMNNKAKTAWYFDKLSFSKKVLVNLTKMPKFTNK